MKKHHDGPCKLCGGPGPIRKSHVIPEFMFTNMYNENHKFVALSPEPDAKMYKLQKGHREPMLCGSCEQRFGRHENYVRSVIYYKPGEAGTGIKVTGHDEGVLIEHLDYSRFKLFQLSVLWRADSSADPFFSDVNLGPHAEPIRRMLLEEDPGEPWRYGCFVTGVLEKPGKIMDAAIAQPHAGHLHGNTCYRFLMGGLFWWYVVSSHSERLPYGDRFITGAGRLIVPFQHWTEIDLFQNFAQQRAAVTKSEPRRS